MLFVDREDNHITSGALYALFFGLIPEVRNITDRNALGLVYNRFMLDNHLLGYTMSLPGSVFMLPGGSLETALVAPEDDEGLPDLD